MESSFDCYTPLERPGPRPQPAPIVPHPSEREDGECDTDSDSPAVEDDSSDSDVPKPRAILLPRRKKVPLPVNNPVPQQPAGGTRKKYDIWTEKIREDSLTETMRNFGVNRDGADGRSVEWYDHTLTNRFAKDGKTNRLKRRRRRDSGGGDEEERDDEDAMDMECGGGKRVCYNSRQNKARILEDLEAGEGASVEEVAKELAEKLKENNEALILQVTQVLGREFVQSIYKETQRIEEDGGMMIMNNRRRRTSGGVFLFLVKHNDEIGEEKKREAFKPIPDASEEAAAKRDEEIEELKKSLTQDSPKLRRDTIRAQETCSTLSNPPPSPVAPTTEEDDDPNNNQNNNSATNIEESGGESAAHNEHMDFN